MRLLFIHQNFPGQFGHLTRELVGRGHELIALGQRVPDEEPQGFVYGRYAATDIEDSYQGVDSHFEAAMHRGHLVRLAIRNLREKGWIPDAVLFHASWGEGLYLRDVLPDQRLVAYPELYGSAWVMGYGLDDQAGEPSLELLSAIHHQNLMALGAIASSDAVVCPTWHQRQTFPAHLRLGIQVIHEGIDVEELTPYPWRWVRVNPTLALRHGDPVVTFCSRHLEPLRGLPTFLRAVAALQKRHSSVQVLVVGENGKGYGPRSEHPGGHLGAMLEELEGQLDLDRLHILGPLPFEQLVATFQVSAAHVYLSYPYTLSWSLLQAMACGAPVVGSRGAPVEEVIRSGENGLLVNFNSPSQLCDALLQLLEDHDQRRRLGNASRRTVEEGYSLKACADRYETLLRGSL